MGDPSPPPNPCPQVVVVGDVPGFFVNRCLGPTISETVALVHQGLGLGLGLATPKPTPTPTPEPEPSLSLRLRLTRCSRVLTR